MSNGRYGNIRLSTVSPDDVEIFYHYTPSRNSIGNSTLNKLTPSDVLIKMDNPNKTQSGVNSFELFKNWLIEKLSSISINACIRSHGTGFVKAVAIK